SQTKPWLPVPPSYKTHNVGDELKDPNSVLQFYRHVLGLRHQNRALLDGDYVALNENDPNVISYLRRYKDQAVLVAINMSGSEQKVSIDLQPQSFASAKATTLVSTDGSQAQEIALGEVKLKPFQVYIGSLAK